MQLTSSASPSSFCLCRTPEQCPSVVSLLSESYNPHVRCGAAMALGICCAGTGNKVSVVFFSSSKNILSSLAINKTHCSTSQFKENCQEALDFVIWTWRRLFNVNFTQTYTKFNSIKYLLWWCGWFPLHLRLIEGWKPFTNGLIFQLSLLNYKSGDLYWFKHRNRPGLFFSLLMMCLDTAVSLPGVSNHS